MLSKLDPQPLIVFTTAYDRYALEAFGVNSVDDLLKPIEAPQLTKALDKVDRMRGGIEPRPEIQKLLDRITALATAGGGLPAYPERIASRIGERVESIDHCTSDTLLRPRQADLRGHSGQELGGRPTPSRSWSKKSILANSPVYTGRRC